MLGVSVKVRVVRLKPLELPERFVSVAEMVTDVVVTPAKRDTTGILVAKLQLPAASIAMVWPLTKLSSADSPPDVAVNLSWAMTAEPPVVNPVPLTVMD